MMTSGRMPDMTPGAKVAWAKTCFIFTFLCYVVIIYVQVRSDDMCIRL